MTTHEHQQSCHDLRGYISVLQEMSDLLGRRGESFRARAYQSASDALALWPHPFHSIDSLKGLKGIGKTIYAKLEEYSQTGRIEALERERANPLHVFTKVYGIGPKKAQGLLDQGITTLDELRSNSHLLSTASQAGLRHYHDIEACIPRSEVEQYDDLLKRLIPDVPFAIVGSYRRGATTSGDIDVILTHEDPGVFQTILDGLLERGVLIEVLSRGDVKCLGIGRLRGGRARRLDFLYAPPDEYAFATLYFTGSKTFNTIQRQRALNLGYSLNEHGLTCLHSSTRVKGDFRTEESIFEFLQMPFVPATERDGARPSGVLAAPSRAAGMTEMEEAELNSRIRQANHAYYELGEPIMSDAEYDLLCATTLRRFPGNQVATEGHTMSPLGQVATKVSLPYEMWSMDKMKPDTDALLRWQQLYTGRCVLSAKLDGVSGLLTTTGGAPRLYTRGNGRLGQDVSHLIPHLSLAHFPKDCVFRGEFIMRKATFKEKYVATFANARNLVAGVINQKHPEPGRVADIDFVVYEMISPPLAPSAQFEHMVGFGLRVARHVSHAQVTNDLLSRYLLDWRAEYEYEIDGVICSHDDVYERVSGNPKHAFAFKMVLSEQMTESIVREVLWSASKDGYLKPRVHIEPVLLGGVTIEYATGFNAQFIHANHIGVGAVVRLVRSGDVIPHIVEVVTPAPVAAMPTVAYLWNETGVDVVLKDRSKDATVQRKNVTCFFRGIGVEGLSEGNIKRLFDAGYETVPQIIRMSQADYLEVPGFQTKMAQKLHTGIRERLHQATLPELMHATNLFGRGFGVKKFESILAVYGTPHISVEQAKVVQGMADKTAGLYVAHLPAFLEWLDETGLQEKLASASETTSQGPLQGKRFVMSGFRDKALSETLIAAGAEPASNVSKNTWVLLMKDVNETTGKAAEARRLGIRIATPDEIKNELI